MILTERLRSANAGSRVIAARRLVGGVRIWSCVVFLSGCYAFIPTTTPVLPAATPITVKLTEGGTTAMRDALGPGVAEVEGTVVRTTSDSLVIAVERMYATGRQAFSSSGTTAVIPRGYVSEVQVRTFSKKRTILTIIGAVALAIGVAASAGIGFGGNAGGGQPPPPT